MGVNIRVGLGVDYHQLCVDRPLMLGGVHVPAEFGALGHSDADVLLHAIADALLGAAGLSDIGTYFPDTDPTYKGIDSKLILTKTIEIIKKAGFRPVNIDSTICLQKPKIGTYVPQMKKIIATICHLSIHDVSVKATTTEKMGFVGRGEGIEAYAVALVRKRKFGFFLFS